MSRRGRLPVSAMLCALLSLGGCVQRLSVCPGETAADAGPEPAADVPVDMGTMEEDCAEAVELPEAVPDLEVAADLEDCAQGEPDCVPSCDGKECGDDGCGGSCGLCTPGFGCADGKCVPTPGGLGSPCDGPADCASQLCLPPEYGGQCTTLASDACEEGWAPELIAGLELLVCVPKHATLCRPCTKDADCPLGACRDLYGMAFVCTVSCEYGCPDGYVCTEGVSLEGKPDQGCQLAEGFCNCLPEYEPQFSLATCYHQNDTGVCWGYKQCQDGGWSECNASWAGPEVCDNMDNDCNGQPDDGALCANGSECKNGKCVEAPCPNCAGKECGDDGCGGACGFCETWETCLLGSCVSDTCKQGCTGHTVDTFLCALDICPSGTVVEAWFASPTMDEIDAAWEAVSHFGNEGNDLAPKAGGSYGLLATGIATGTEHSYDLPLGVSGPDPVNADLTETYDNVEFHALVTAPAEAIGFAFTFIFMSVEYQEYVGTVFSDRFYVFVTSSMARPGETKEIAWTDCLWPEAYYDFIDGQGNPKCYISVNTAASEPCTGPVTNILGTGYECGLPDDATHGSSTGWHRTSWPVVPGQTFELVFHIHDSGDAVYDSEVILDDFEWLTGPFIPGTEKL